MHYRRFGKTNLQLSIFSLGTMRCLNNENQTGLVIEKAIAAGINHLETAQSYGNGEIFLGQALKVLGVPRSSVYITTKGVPTASASAMADQIDQSFNRLNLEYIDCFAVHGINTKTHLEWVQQPNGCMAAIREAKAQGRIRHIGFSTHGSLDVILGAIATQQFEFINLHYYFFGQRNASALIQAQAEDMGVFIISPADKGGLLHTPPPSLVELCHPYSPLELTYRFLLADHRITTLSIGPSTIEELAKPLGLADSSHGLTSEELALLAKLEHHQQLALSADHCRQCYECLPCPESISIPEVLRLRNLTVAFDMTQYGQYRYQMFEQAGHWFPGRKASACTACGDCLPRCPEHLNIPDLLNDTHQRLQGPGRRRLWS